MRAGTLDRFITIMRKTVAYDNAGSPVETWEAIGPFRRSASVRPVPGDERLTAEAISASNQTIFKVRPSAEIATLNPLDRIVYPALETEDEDDIENWRIHDIRSVVEVGRDALEITATSQADTGR